VNERSIIDDVMAIRQAGVGEAQKLVARLGIDAFGYVRLIDLSWIGAAEPWVVAALVEQNPGRITEGKGRRPDGVLTETVLVGRVVQISHELGRSPGTDHGGRACDQMTELGPRTS